MARVGLCLLVIATAVSAQWLETIVYLPDTLNETAEPMRIFYNPGNNNLFIFGSGRTVLVLDGVTGRKIARVELPGSYSDFCYNPRENRIYLAGEYITVIDAAGCRVAGVINPGFTTNDICYNPELNRVYAVGGMLVVVVDAGADSIIGTISLPWSSSAIECATRVNKVYCALDNEDVVVIDCQRDSVIARFYSGAGPYAMLYNHLTNRLYIAEGYDEDITVVDCDRDTVVRWLVAGYEPRLMCLNPVSNKFYCADWYNNWFGIYDAGADTLIRWILLGTRGQRGLVFDSIDNLIYVSLYEDDSLVVIDGVSDELLRTVPVPGYRPWGLAYNPRAQRVYCAEYGSQSVSIYDAPTSALVGFLPMERFQPQLLTRIASNERIYCASPGARFIIPLEGASCRLRAPVFLPAALDRMLYAGGVNRVYCSSVDSSITVVDCATERVRGVVRMPFPPVAAVYAPDVNRIYLQGPVATESTIVVFDCLNDSVSGYIYTRPGPQVLSYIPAQHLLYFTEAGSGILTAYDVVEQQRIAEISLPGEIGQVCHLPAFNLLAVSFNGDPRLYFIDCSTHTVQDSLYVSGIAASMLYNPVNNRLYILTFADTLLVVAPELSAVVDTVVPALRSPWMVALDTIANKLYLASAYQVQVINCQTNQPGEVIRLPAMVGTGVWSPGTRRLFVTLPSRLALAVIRDSAVVGTAEEQVGAEGLKAVPTVVRGVLNLNPELAPVLLMDVSGRCRLVLKSGMNDLRSVAPGVYFIISRQDKRSGIRKLIIAR
ncbi:MAG: YncE family protein [candidate division WOR-3 bacterium]